MEEWKEYKLGDVCLKIGSGATPSGGKEAYKGGHYSLVRSQNVLDFSFSYDGLAKINETQAEKLKNVELKENDVLLNITGDSVARACILPKYVLPGRVNQHVAIIRPNKEILDFHYLLYFLQIEKQKLLSLAAGGATRNALTKQMIENYIIKLPPLPTQQKIAAILSSLDDKIELNNKINTNLEQQAQALFKNWFVDFEPFGGKMPEGWKEADIYSIANIIYGSPFASKLFNTEKNGKPIIRIRDLKDQHSDVYTPEERDDAYLIQPKDIVVGMDGEFRPYIWGSEPGWLNQRVCVFENKRPKGKVFLYFSIKPLLDVVEKTQVATTVIHIGKKDFDKFKITLPTEDILDKFDELTNPILDQIVANRLENRRLAELRDALLPKLMNGEIEV